MAIIWYKFFRCFKLCQNVGAQIPLPPMDEKKKVIEDVDKDRRYAIDASIVRIMKSRKVLPHQQLVLECVEQLGRMFKVSLLFCPFSCVRLFPLIIQLCMPTAGQGIIRDHRLMILFGSIGLNNSSPRG